MSAPRMPFLWPVFYKSARISRPSRRIPRQKPPIPRGFSTSIRRVDASNLQRYGTAQEPAPHLRDSEQMISQERQDPDKSQSANDQKNEPVEEEEDEPQQPAPLPKPNMMDATESAPQTPAPDPVQAPDSKPLDTILYMPSPTEEEQRKPPHLKTPPYVHHFDTYSLVKDLGRSGFTDEQSVTLMKAVRGILADNMELAREGLISKSNVENETYLFRAACSELRTEIGNNRKGETEKMRTERNQLQHEVDILNQRLSQETGNLKDELKGLFDDRKMTVRQEQRFMESKIQELNYKITVALTSDARSEVEGMRWILTRRAAIALGIMAIMLFGALRYSASLMHVQQEEKKADKKPPSDEEGGTRQNNPSPISAEEAIGGELLVTEGGVSLS
ncbi:hypothetical protein EJ04DRAFT_436213 [Polyplosphaeria fusca]|uniref:Uncharacterized protein n=1 Tax=Polyplosphaeria fusca TaxID=682080 RepID=A0A9P4V369_9PLEO|nr:hypothetical protein EJ04DRAFT_436213 [Polyplosphaeria fusca]